MSAYEPLNTLKPVADNIWVVDGPLIRFYKMPFSTRMTVVRLANGDVWLHSPTQLTDELAAEVAALGPVKYLIAPNWIHYAYVAQWQQAFTQAKAWAAPGVRERAEKFGMEVRFEHELRQDADAGWADDIDQMIVEGSTVHREAVFFHKATATLILTDLIENFEAKNLPFYMRFIARLAGVLDPNGKMPWDMRQTYRGHKAQLRGAIERMIEWKPERIILAHGRWYKRGGVAELKRAFGWVL